MNFRPPEPRGMWDTWIFPWEGRYHLFYIENYGPPSTDVGHWVGDDLLHWEERPSIPIVTGKAGDWNEKGGVLTGMVVHHEGTFHLFAGATHNAAEMTGVFLSRDLETWEPHAENPVLCAAGPHYLDKPARPFFYDKLDFRDPYIFHRPEDGQFHALLHGRRPQWSHEDTGAVFAHLRSTDLIHWEHLPPLDAPTGLFEKTEVPDLFELDGRCYLAFTSRSRGGLRLSTDGRESADGTFYMMADNWDGPFHLPDDYLLVGAEKGVRGPYCGHTIVSPDHGRILYHHITGDRPALSVPKKVRTRSDGTLWLEYMPLLELLESETICDSAQQLPSFEPRDWGEWERSDGRVTAKAKSVGSSCRVVRWTTDVHLCCDIRLNSAAGAGVVLRSIDDHGVWVFLNRDRQQLEVGAASYRLNMGWSRTSGGDACRCELDCDREYRLRCFARDEHFEVYLDDRWVFTLDLASEARTGDIELFVERGDAVFSNLRIAALHEMS